MNEDGKDFVDMLYEIFIQPKRKPTMLEQLSNPRCTLMTLPGDCQQPDFCFIHKPLR